VWPRPRPDIIGTAHAARGDEGREHQRHFVADAARRVLVDSGRPHESNASRWPEASMASVSAASSWRSSPRSSTAMKQRRHLVVGDAVRGVRGDQGGPLFWREGAAVALALDERHDQH